MGLPLTGALSDEPLEVAIARAREARLIPLKGQGFRDAAGLFHRECGKDGDNSSVVPRILPE